MSYNLLTGGATMPVPSKDLNAEIEKAYGLAVALDQAVGILMKTYKLTPTEPAEHSVNALCHTLVDLMEDITHINDDDNAFNLRQFGVINAVEAVLKNPIVEGQPCANPLARIQDIMDAYNQAQRAHHGLPAAAAQPQPANGAPHG
jgi:hypothetical protein